MGWVDLLATCLQSHSNCLSVVAMTVEVIYVFLGTNESDMEIKYYFQSLKSQLIWVLETYGQTEWRRVGRYCEASLLILRQPDHSWEFSHSWRVKREKNQRRFRIRIRIIILWLWNFQFIFVKSSRLHLFKCIYIYHMLCWFFSIR